MRKKKREMGRSGRGQNRHSEGDPSHAAKRMVEVTAIASRTLEKAQQAASSLGLPKAYGSYEELLSDPEIEAIYNPLPNHLHVPWSIRCG